MRACNLVTVAASVDRPNIFLSVLKRPASTGAGHSVQDSYDFVIKPIINELIKDKDDFPKTIIYANLNWCGYGHELASRPSRDGSPSTIGHLVGQYHMPCTTEVSTVKWLCYIATCMLKLNYVGRV